MKTKQIPFGPNRLVANMCFGSVLAVIGGTATAFTTTGTPSVSVDGTVFALTAQTNTALTPLSASDLPTSGANWAQPSGLTGSTAATGFYTQPANTTVYYVIGVNASGSWRVVQGLFDNRSPQSAALDPQGLSASGGVISTGYTVGGKSVIPDVPDGFTPVAVVKVVSGGALFTPGTTALTGLATFKNVSVIPSAETF